MTKQEKVQKEKPLVDFSDVRLHLGLVLKGNKISLENLIHSIEQYIKDRADLKLIYVRVSGAYLRIVEGDKE
jgi:hypothetical protein